MSLFPRRLDYVVVPSPAVNTPPPLAVMVEPTNPDLDDDHAWEQSIRRDERQRIADLIHQHRFDGTNEYATPDTWHAAATRLEHVIRNHQGDNT